MKLLKTLTNQRKNKILRAMAIIMVIAGIYFFAASVIWKVKTGQYIDVDMTSSFKTNATAAVVGSSLAVVIAPIALLLAYKNKQLSTLILLILAALFLIFAFFMPLKDQKEYSAMIDVRRDIVAVLTHPENKQSYFEYVQNNFTIPAGPVQHDSHIILNHAELQHFISLGAVNDFDGMMKITGANEALLKFTNTVQIMTHHGLVSAKANLHTMNVAAAITSTVLIGLAFFLNYYKAVDARTVTIQMPVKKEAKAKKAPKKATKAKK